MSLASAKLLRIKSKFFTKAYKTHYDLDPAHLFCSLSVTCPSAASVSSSANENSCF